LYSRHQIQFKSLQKKLGLLLLQKPCFRLIFCIPEARKLILLKIPGIFMSKEIPIEEVNMLQSNGTGIAGNAMGSQTSSQRAKEGLAFTNNTQQS